MPLPGLLAAGAFTTAAAMPGTSTAPLDIENVVVVHAHFEVSRAAALPLLPPALTPTIPASVYFTVWQAEAGPLGPFTLAQVRLGCRAGIRGRGLLLGAVIDNAEAGRQLEARWGLRAKPGAFRVEVDAGSASVSVANEGSTCLLLALERLETASSGELAWPASLHPAHIASRDGEGALLVQFDPEYEFSAAWRGSPWLGEFDGACWHAGALEPRFPIGASVGRVRLRLPAIRYVLSPG